MFTEKYYENEDFREAEILESSLTGMTFINCSFQGADLAAIELQSSPPFLPPPSTTAK